MNPPTDLTAMAFRELDTIATIADDITEADFDRASNLPDWTTEQLLRHIADVAFAQAEALHRARFDVTEAPTMTSLTAPREQLAETLRSVLAHARRGVSGLDLGTDPVVPLPFGSFPASLAGFVLLVEYGIHRYDVEQTITGAGTLPDDIAEAIADRLSLVLMALGSADTPPAMTIRLQAEGRPAATLTWQSGRWANAAEDATPNCVVSGPGDAVVLFATGRVPTTDSRLVIDDPARALGHFKSMFPGP